MYYSQSEILDGIEALSDEDIKRLHYIALIKLGRSATFNEAKDAVQDAILSVMEGGRTHMKKEHSFVKNMEDIVYSMTGAYKQKVERDDKLVKDTIHLMPLQTDTLDLDTYDYNIDQRVLGLLQAIESDNACKTMMKLKLCGYTKIQIREKMKLSTQQYDSIYRRMTRKLSTLTSHRDAL